MIAAKTAYPPSRLWGIVLANRVDERRRVSVGRGSYPHDKGLFRQTLEHASRLIPEERLVTVLARSHAAYYDDALAALPGVQRVVQPAYRGSAPEIFLAVLKIGYQDPDATVVVLPSPTVGSVYDS